VTGAIRIQVRRTTGTEPPPDLQFGELAFADDGSRLFIGQVDGTVHEFVTAQPDPVLGTTLAGEGLYVGRDGDVLQFKGLVAGDNVTLTPEADRLTIAAAGDAITGASLAGEGLYVGRDGDVLQFKGLVAGDNVTLTPEADRLTIAAAGDAITGATLAGEGLYVGRDGDVLQFKGLVAGDNIALIPEANRLTIAASNSSLLNGFQAYTVAGTYYWTVPDGVYFALTKTIGAGAGGAAFNNLIGGGGGGGGGKAEKLVAGLVPGEIIIITVGAGGIAGVSSGDGQAGGTSSFGPFVSATGGKGGSRFGHGGQAGVGIGGDFNTSLGPGVLGSLWADDPNRPVGGAGGGPSDRIIFSQNAPPGLGPGAGGGGGGSDNGSVKTPSPGRDGAVIIRW